jgi:hypothetical protein
MLRICSLKKAFTASPKSGKVAYFRSQKVLPEGQQPLRPRSQFFGCIEIPSPLRSATEDTNTPLALTGAQIGASAIEPGGPVDAE